VEERTEFVLVIHFRDIQPDSFTVGCYIQLGFFTHGKSCRIEVE